MTTRRPPVRYASSARAAGMRGFTLIELMIVVAIIAILAAIVIPSYQDSIWKGKRGEAKAAILKTLQAEERYYSQNNTYVQYASGAAPAGGAFPNWSADNQANSRYKIDVVTTALTGMCPDGDVKKCVIVVATVTGTGPDPMCGATMLMDTVGNKSAAINDPRCWK